MSWHEDSHYYDPETGISGWGFLPTAEQQVDREAIFIMELEIQGYKLAAVLPTRATKERVNWHYGDPEKYLEKHWTMFEPGYASEEDELAATSTSQAIEEFRSAHESIYCVPPSEQMKIEAGYPDELPEGHGLVAIMVKDSSESQR